MTAPQRERVQRLRQHGRELRRLRRPDRARRGVTPARSSTPATPEAYARAVTKAGYATDPQYADKWLAIYHGDRLEHALRGIDLPLPHPKRPSREPSWPDILNIGLSALLAQQRALTTTANNIANASTPGYSRQRVELTERPAERLGIGLRGHRRRHLD